MYILSHNDYGLKAISLQDIKDMVDDKKLHEKKGMTVVSNTVFLSKLQLLTRLWRAPEISVI